MTKNENQEEKKEENQEMKSEELGTKTIRKLRSFTQMINETEESKLEISKLKNIESEE